MALPFATAQVDLDLSNLEGAWVCASGRLLGLFQKYSGDVWQSLSAPFRFEGWLVV